MIILILILIISIWSCLVVCHKLLLISWRRLVTSCPSKHAPFSTGRNAAFSLWCCCVMIQYDSWWWRFKPPFKSHCQSVSSLCWYLHIVGLYVGLMIKLSTLLSTKHYEALIKLETHQNASANLWWRIILIGFYHHRILPQDRKAHNVIAEYSWLPLSKKRVVPGWAVLPICHLPNFCNQFPCIES